MSVSSYHFYRPPRDKRPGLSLTERDLRILEIVSDYAVIDAQMLKALITAEFPGSYDDSLKRRLQKLFVHEYLNRPVEQVVLQLRDGQRHLVYTVGREGAEILARRRGIPLEQIKWRLRDDEKSYKTLDHTLAISKFRTCLTLALKANALDLDFWKRDGELAFKIAFRVNTQPQAVLFRVPEGERAARTVRPDGFFAFNNHFYALEVDRGTMGLSGVAKKMLGYLKFWKLIKEQPKQINGYTIKDFRVITVTTNERRLRHLQETARRIDDKPGQGWRGFLFCLEGDYTIERPESILGPIMHTPVVVSELYHKKQHKTVIEHEPPVTLLPIA